MAKSFKKIILLVTIAALFVFIFTLIRATLYSPESVDQNSSNISETAVPEKISTTSLELSYPSRLIIQKLKLDAKVQHVGIGKKGGMGIPTNFTDVGWYKYGTLPGAKGSAVMDGHVDNGLSLPGVFKQLSSLQEGDDVYVLMQNGNSLRFVVERKDYYDYADQSALNIIFNQDDSSWLRLITCVGDWVPKDRTYDQRLVVTAKLVK